MGYTALSEVSTGNSLFPRLREVLKYISPFTTEMQEMRYLDVYEIRTRNKGQRETAKNRWRSKGISPSDK